MMGQFREDSIACSTRPIWKITFRPNISCAASTSAWISVICAPTWQISIAPPGVPRWIRI